MEIADSYDAIVIGSGIGGLTTASLLSRIAGKRVLVLERHFKLGGFTHSFQRKQYSWDPGVHYVGEMGAGSQLREIFDLVTGGGVEWARMPQRFERFIYPGMDFAVDSDRDQYIADLKAAFPGEAEAIARYFKDVKTATSWYQRYMAGKAMPGLVGRMLELPGRKLALTLTGDYLTSHFSDPKLRALLTSQWGDYGLPPSRSPFAIHALIVDHYLRGAWYPVGGAGSIAAAAVPVITAAGGACAVDAEVTEILVEKRKVTGVRVAQGHGDRRTTRVVHAPLVVSDAGADITYTRLLPAELKLRERELVRELPQSVSAVQLFLGLNRDPRELGMSGENLWIATGFDHDAAYEGRAESVTGGPAGCFVVFPSLKDPRARAHTAEIITLADADTFASWAGGTWKRRGEEYEELKRSIAESLIDLADRHVPGLRDSVAFSELATPLSLAHFTGTRTGACYGLAVTPERLRARWLGVKTPIRGLLLTGSDVGSPGVAGAMMGGVLTAARVLGPAGFPRIMKAAQATSPVGRQESRRERIAATL